jgi:hypothetical protein
MAAPTILTDTDSGGPVFLPPARTASRDIGLTWHAREVFSDAAGERAPQLVAHARAVDFQISTLSWVLTEFWGAFRNQS